MHFLIVKLEKADTPVEDFDTDLDCVDTVLLAHTDYYGDIYNAEQRKEVIESSWFKDIFEGFADVDTEKETITFYDKETCLRNFSNYLEELTKELHEKAVDGKLSGYQFRNAGVEYKEHSTMFYINHGYTSFDLVEDAAYFAGQTFKIGNIFDAHF